MFIIFLLCQIQHFSLSTEEIESYRAGGKIGLVVDYHVKKPIDGFDVYLVPNTIFSLEVKTKQNFIKRIPINAKKGSIVIQLDEYMRKKEIFIKSWTIHMDPYINEAVKFGDINLYRGKLGYQPDRVIEPEPNIRDLWESIFRAIEITEAI